jgi:hypothetical protein
MHVVSGGALFKTLVVQDNWTVNINTSLQQEKDSVLECIFSKGVNHKKNK